MIAEKAFEHLDAPVERLSPPNTRYRSPRRWKTRSFPRWPTSRPRSSGSPHGDHDRSEPGGMTRDLDQDAPARRDDHRRHDPEVAQEGGRHGRPRRAAVRDLHRQGGHGGPVPRRRDRRRRSSCRKARRSPSAPSSRRSTRATVPPPPRRPRGRCADDSAEDRRSRGARGLPRGAGPTRQPVGPRPKPRQPPRQRRPRRCRTGAPVAGRVAARAPVGGRARRRTVLDRKARAPAAASRRKTSSRPSPPAPRRLPAAGVPTGPADLGCPARARPRPAKAKIVQPTHIRKAIAEHMVGLAPTTARAWTMVEVNVDHLVQLRERSRSRSPSATGSSSHTCPWSRASVRGALSFPMVNAALRGDELVVRQVRAHGDRRELRPGVDRAGDQERRGDELPRARAAIADLATRARSHQLKPDEVQEPRSRSRTRGRTGRC